MVPKQRCYTSDELEQAPHYSVFMLVHCAWHHNFSLIPISTVHVGYIKYYTDIHVCFQSLSLLNTCVYCINMVLSELVWALGMCTCMCISVYMLYLCTIGTQTKPHKLYDLGKAMAVLVNHWWSLYGMFQCLGEGSGSYSRYPLLSQKAVSPQWCYMHCLY